MTIPTTGLHVNTCKQKGHINSNRKKNTIIVLPNYQTRAKITNIISSIHLMLYNNLDIHGLLLRGSGSKNDLNKHRLKMCKIFKILFIFSHISFKKLNPLP